MYGLDFFFKAVETGMKMAQKSVENFFRFMEISARNVSQPDPSEKAAADEEKRNKPDPAETQKQEGSPQISKPAAFAAKASDDGKSSPNIEENLSAKPKKSMESQSISERKERGEKKQIQPAESYQNQKETPLEKAPPTAIGAVLEVIVDKQKPLATEEIMEATGFTKKKVQSNLYKLKKRGEIKMVEKGVYVKS